jgi:hypothetical protein
VTARVRLDSLRIGDRFTSMAGERFRIVAWYKDVQPSDGHACPIVEPLDGGHRTMFAGRAEGTRIV